MKYYLIVGEASGDLHASHLMRALKKEDAEAGFRFFGGDLMQAEGGTMVRHYRELAYMGFIPVLMHLPTILRAQKECVADIRQWQPDVVILVDYPGFNLRVAKQLSRCEDGIDSRYEVRGARCENSNEAQTSGPDSNLVPRTSYHAPRKTKGSSAPRIYYYISPKIWAWKEWRIKSIRRYVDELFSILPFEVDFYEGKHHYPIHYVGNPTADEVREYLEEKREDRGCEGTKVRGCENGLSRYEVRGTRYENSDKAQASGPDGNLAPRTSHLASRKNEGNLAPSHPCTSAPPKVIAPTKLIALLSGSRRQEIKDNLPAMLKATSVYRGYRIVVAGAPGIEPSYYEPFMKDYSAEIVFGKTYELLSQATMAVVTSGTATLETALFNVPQVVCYKTPVPHLIRFAFNHIIHCKYISLVNLIADEEVVPELLADRFSVKNIRKQLRRITPGKKGRREMLAGYERVRQALGNRRAPEEAARLMVRLLTE